jgi:hypothetical protein
MRGGLFAAAAVAAVAVAAPAGAIGIHIGIGARLGNSGVHTGAGYRFGNWNDRLHTSIVLDANQILRQSRRSNRPDRPRERAEVEDGRPTRDVRNNVELRIKPDVAWVYLNGVRVRADGREKITLPEGRHRLEFLFPGHRSEVAELDVQPGIRYRVTRTLAKLEPGERPDPRLLDPAEPASLEEALRPQVEK